LHVFAFLSSGQRLCRLQAAAHRAFERGRVRAIDMIARRPEPRRHRGRRALQAGPAGEGGALFGHRLQGQQLHPQLRLRLCQRGGLQVFALAAAVADHQRQHTLFGALESFRNNVNGLHRELRGELHIGLTDNLVTVPHMRITHALARLKELGPDVRIQIRMTPPSEVEQGVLDGSLHVGVVPQSHALSGLEYQPLYGERSQLYCAVGHPLFYVDDQQLTERTFVMWDMIHDRAHMRGDLPFDPFMIKQRMPFFLYTLEELRCDLTAFREAVRLQRDEATDAVTREHAQLVQYAVIFDRIFRFSITGTRTRNYDGVGGQLLFAWMHQKGVLHWTDTQLAIDWDAVPDVVVSLSDAINELYWRSIDRPKGAHWLAAHELVSSVLTPNPASHWAAGLPREVLEGPLKGWTDLVMDDEFPLSMFYEALQKKMAGVIESTAGITGTSE